jgi:membrane protein
VRIHSIRQALLSAYRDVIRHHALQVSAALSYYFVLSVFPGLMFLSAVFGSLRLSDLFNHVLLLMSRLLPPDTMHVVRSVLSDVLSSHRGTWLSFGMIGTIWVASTGFAALIEALDIAYDAEDDRPYWKTRLLAVGLAAITGTLLLAALATMIVGPRFGDWISTQLALRSGFAAVWPPLRWAIAITFTVIAVEIVYYLAPNVKQRFGATLPGAIFSVAVWNTLSYLLGIYFRHFADFSRTYGTLGGLIALMTWLYWTSFALLVGAELNAELAKQSKKGCIESKTASVEENQQQDQATDINRAA